MTDASGGEAIVAHLIWDLDGTLVDSRGDLVDAVNAGLQSVGCGTLSTEAIVSFIGDGTRNLVARALHAAGGDAGANASALAAFHEFYEAHLLDRTGLYPHVAEALQALAARGVVLSVLTNKGERYSRAILHGLGVAKFFAHVVGGDSGRGLKPDVGGINSLRDESGIPVERTWMIGDSPVDMAVAQAAGVHAVGVRWGFRSPQDLMEAGAQTIVGSPQEIVQLSGLGANATSRTSSISDAKVN